MRTPPGIEALTVGRVGVDTPVAGPVADVVVDPVADVVVDPAVDVVEVRP